MRNSIPVLGVPVLNRGDYLKRLFDSFGNQQIDHIVIINNGNDNTVKEAIHDIHEKFQHRSNIEIVTPGENWGCAKSWNYILKKYIVEHGYVWMAANDVAFRNEDDIQKVLDWQKKDREENFGKLGTINYGDVGYGFWLMNSTHFERMGTFDENFYPAYYEDIDYNRRMFLMDQECQKGIRSENVSMRNIPDIKLIHCEPDSEVNPDVVIDYESGTIHSDAKLKELNDITFFKNLGYYTLKWGGDRRKEIYNHPYGDSNNDLNFWKFIPDHRKEVDIWNKCIFGD